MAHRRGCNPHALLRAALVCAVAWPWGAGTLSATEVLMKDGRLLKGNLGKTSGLADMNLLPDANSRKDTPIVFLDDNLRRTFVSQQQVQEIRADSQLQVPEKFRVRQPSGAPGPGSRRSGPSSASGPSTNSAAAASPWTPSTAPWSSPRASPRSRRSGPRSRGSAPTYGTCGSPPARSPATSSTRC